MNLNQFFKNKNPYPAENISKDFFKNGEYTVKNIIYFPDGNSGINNINRVAKILKKKSILNEIVINKQILFLGKKVINTRYIEKIKKENPGFKISFNYKPTQESLKTSKINIYDLSPYHDIFYSMYGTKSPIMVKSKFFEIINSVQEEIKDPNILMIDLRANHLSSENILFENIIKLFKRNGSVLKSGKTLLNIDLLDGIIIYLKENNKDYFYPLTYKDDNGLHLNQSTLTRIQSVLNDLNPSDDKNDITKNTSGETESEGDHSENEIDKILNISSELNSINKELQKMSKENIDKLESLDELNIHLIRLSDKDPDLHKIKKVEDKLAYLSKKYNSKELRELSEVIKEINKKHNGVIEIKEDLLIKSNNSYYNPIDIIGFNDFNAYNKQKTEFDETLDAAIHDMIHSLEKNPNYGIKILGIESKIIDTNKSRFKEFKVKVKNLNHGSTRAYTLSFNIPYPVKNKYLKMDGNYYVMINQFFPKPIVKVQPNIVRLYTQYNSISVELKHHFINNTNTYKDLINNFIKLLTDNKHQVKNNSVKLDLDNNSEVQNKFGLNHLDPELAGLNIELN